jgi:Flp pilus assembly protein TadG
MMNRKLRKALCNDKGTAMVELALIAPVLALASIGVVDMSNAFSRKLALEQGAQRAIEKIMQTTGDSSVQDTLKLEVLCQVNGTAETDVKCPGRLTAANVTVSYRLECSVAGSSAMTFQTSVDADAFDAFVCPTGNIEARYIQVAVTDQYKPLFPIHFATFDSSDGTYHLSATAGMRTQ